jgi:hypothetical protein
LNAARAVYRLQVRHPASDQTPLETGVAAVDLSRANEAQWTNEDFFVPDSLSGGEIEDRFLALFLAHLKKEHAVQRCVVTILARAHKLGPAASAERTRLIEFYRQQDFHTTGQGDFNCPLSAAITPDEPSGVSSWVQLSKQLD